MDGDLEAPPPPHPSNLLFLPNTGVLGPSPCPSSASPAQQHEAAAGPPRGTDGRPSAPTQASHPTSGTCRAPSSWPPGRPAPPGPPRLPRPPPPHQGAQPWPAPLSPVKSKHAHTTQASASFLRTRPPSCRQQEQQRGERRGEAPAHGGHTGPRAAAPSRRSHPGRGGRAAQRPRSHGGRPAAPTRLVGGRVRRGQGGPPDSDAPQRALRTALSPPKRPQAEGALHEHLLCVRPGLRHCPLPPLRVGRRAEPQGGQSSSEVKSPPSPRPKPGSGSRRQADPGGLPPRLLTISLENPK